MAVYLNITLKRRVKVQDPQPDNVVQKIEEESFIVYPFGVEEIEESVDVTVEDAD